MLSAFRKYLAIIAVVTCIAAPAVPPQTSWVDTEPPGQVALGPGGSNLG
jgi:hypothetical protein